MDKVNFEDELNIRHRVNFENTGSLERDCWSALCCPSCGETYLHQRAAEVGFRSEDGHGDVTTIDGTSVKTEMAENGDPRFSPRRDRITIHFTCENCDAKPRLMISQHKGRTFLEWATR
jgi:hypothetical protein